MSFTYYDVLGVHPKASQYQIRKAYQQRVKLVHPDVVHDDRALRRVKLLNRAYAVLRHNERREVYDQTILRSTGQYNCQVERLSPPKDFRWLASVSLWLMAIAIVWFFNSLEITELLKIIYF